MRCKRSNSNEIIFKIPSESEIKAVLPEELAGENPILIHRIITGKRKNFVSKPAIADFS